jgi:hypothetical protein
MMKTIGLSALVFVVVFSGLTLAAQSGEQKERPSMPMQEMMKSGKEGDHMSGRMRMMKMMDQCSAMMNSAHDHREKGNESQSK